MKRICSVILSSLIFAFMLSMSVSAEAENDVLAAYQEVLDTFNEQYGVSVRFPTESELSDMGLTIQDRNEFITAMTTEEYFEHLVDVCLYADDVIELECESDSASIEQTASKPVMTRAVQQKFIYGNNSNNYLFINVNRYYVGGTCYYGSVTDGGSVYTSYPYYYCSSYNPTFESNYTKVKVDFYCSYYPSSGATQTNVTVSCKFRASDNVIYDNQLYI